MQVVQINRKLQAKKISFVRNQQQVQYAEIKIEGYIGWAWISATQEKPTEMPDKN